MNKPVNILVDSGSTHNFIDRKLAAKLGLQGQDSKPFDVMVANGEKISGSGVQGCAIGVSRCENAC